jgi:hypothetical protein
MTISLKSTGFALAFAALVTSTSGADAAGWVFCSPERGFCSAPPGSFIHYGRHGVFATRRSPPGGLPCNNGVFGDPLVGVPKECFFSW